MLFLPKANPLYEHIAAGKVVLPDVLEKLGTGGFTGYLNHGAPAFESYCVFAKGNLICAMSNDGIRAKNGFEAITALFDKAAAGVGEINVYRMTSDLSMCAHALVAGSKLISGDEVRQVDIKAVLARMKAQSLNGVVHFYTTERFAMMFYKDGQPVGFYHDSARSIEASPEESRRVAALPGARVDVCVTKPIEELMTYNLLQMVNLDKLWTSAKSRSALPQEKPSAATVPVADPAKLAELVEDLKEIASAYLARPGKDLVDQVISRAGGSGVLMDSAKTAQLLAQLERDAAAIDSDARIDEMVDLMKSEIAGRLAV